ncbi:NAD(+)--rifampin ADP-ribosyltransferase [Flavobacterium sp. NG2]|nr:NAD(+)--rifampin ADP-ribosyltransferase [Flavobacterium sp. NG2]WPR70339.1 NAD(+)--rifampin ADP-ribosyltransferase [Flavobacterium sp. NG2]
MEFSPFNKVVQLCIQGMDMEENSQNAEAEKLFLQAWEVATNDFEKFLAAHYIARQQKTISDKLNWLETALEFALKENNDAVKSALASLYYTIAQCHKALKNEDKATENFNLASSHQNNPSDKGPFYHGTRADLQIGDLLIAGGKSNYKSELQMNHICFTALVNGAGLAAALAKGDGNERVYIVEPTGIYENDPNLTDKKFPGNPSRSYRSEAPLKIVGEVTEWVKQSPEDIKKFREKLENNKGEIIN